MAVYYYLEYDHTALFLFYVVGRFGPGMVIYWLGHVDTIPEKENGILIRSEFPEQFITMEALNEQQTW